MSKKDKNEETYNSDITAEDKQALNKKGRSMNKGQDKDLDDKEQVDFTAEELDIPGSRDSNPSKTNNLVDEENYRFNKKGVKKNKKDMDDFPDPDTTEN
ncbi:hypothetical protein SAMN05444483_101556 [Salegentibacter echinorum]|uniref:Uncharacterized protein n=1 Tax=Salegentibacter echinorum TaxID=1073325 RepID=A0A1M5CJY2_SALEC|nr:hypothetical protein [Salegentibacter echinorum]SHF55011.1 hypothetical protein SAMN05444483_101556 [Salegentibacter echinorum]